jgi:hypothetical protein
MRIPIPPPLRLFSYCYSSVDYSKRRSPVRPKPVGRGIESGERAQVSRKAKQWRVAKILPRAAVGLLAPKSVDFAESPPHMEAGKVIKVQVREMFLRR